MAARENTAEHTLFSACHVTVTIKDNGAIKMLEQLSQPPSVARIGVIGGEASAPHDKSPLTVGEIAAIHEYGLGVPERSFVRDFVDGNRSKLHRMMRATALEVARGRSQEEAMARFGLAVAGMIKKRMIAGINPPLKESTKERKQQITGGNAKDTPLILSGQLISAIVHDLLND